MKDAKKYIEAQGDRVTLGVGGTDTNIIIRD
jgi:hypothetical protein